MQKKRTSRARKQQKYEQRETGRKTRARGKISFQINDNYIELKTKIYNYAKRQTRQINQMPNTHTHTAAKYVGYLHNKPVIKVIDFFCQNKKKVNLVIMEFFF